MRTIISICLLLLMSLCTSAQTYSKELEKVAKKGDPVAQKDMGVCYLDGRGINQNIKKAYKWLLESSEQGNADAIYYIALMADRGQLSEASIKIPAVKERGGKPELRYARYMYKKAAELGQPNALVWLGRGYDDEGETKQAFDCYKKAADAGNGEAQYLLGYMYYYGIGTSTNLGEAKKLFSLAAESGREEALAMVNEIRQKQEREIRDSIDLAKREEERVRREEEERVRREEENKRLTADRELRKKKLDSLSAVTGVPASYMSLKYQCTIIPRYSDDWRGHEQVVKEFQALCANDLFKYYGKEDLSGLDKTLYMKSEDFQRDKRAFEEKKKTKFAICIRLGWEPYGWNGPDTKPYFEGNGFGFYTTISNNRYLPTIKKNHVMLGENGIPVKNCVLESGGFGQKLFFVCNDLEKLQYIRDNYSNIDVVFVFKPSFRKNLPSELTYNISKEGVDYFIGSTVGIYVYNAETDELLLDLSKYGRNIDSQVEKQKENGFFNSDKAKIMAEIRKNTPQKHSTPKQERCAYCAGKGYVEYFPVGSATLATRRCTNCYGKGYTMEYYY